MILAWLLSLLFTVQVDSCIASQFAHKGDKLAGGVSRALGRRVLPTDHGIAHRRLPLNSWILVCNPRTSLCSLGTVLDRGPYGMVDAEGWFNSARAPERKAARIAAVGRRKAYRGCVDLTPSIARGIGHNGFERVRVYRF